MLISGSDKKIKLHSTIFGILAIGCFLFFGGAKSVRAAQPCVCYPSLPAKCFDDKAYSLAECSSACTSAGYASGELAGSDEKCSTTPKSALSNAIQHPLAPVADWAKSALGAVVVGLLTAILDFFGLLLSVAAMIFAWAADARNLTAVINGDNIYKSWMIVRDLLNIAFILVLLYTAFTIIFQVDSSNKKIILTVVLMALLVNFSFPITRFIIDVGNSLMYTIFNSLLPDASSKLDNIFSNIANKSAIGDIINGNLSGASVTQLIGAIVFTAILAITFLTMAILFVIRIVALALIIIFSPVAFVGAAVPGMSSKTGKWWGYLFNYTFFGPAMAFMIFIATKVMNTTTLTTTSNDPLLIGMSKFAIPVVILWIGMGVAKTMGIAGADMVQKWSTKAVMWLPKAIAHSTGVPGGFKQAADYYKKKGAPGFLGKIPGLRGEEKTEELEAKIGGLLTKGGKGWSSAAENIQRKRIAAKQKEFEDERLSESAAKAKLKSGDNVEKKAAALYLSKKDKINDSETFADAMKALAGDEELQKELRGKAKKDNNIKFVLKYDLDHGITIKDETTGKETVTKDKATIYAKTLDMSSDDLAKQKSLHDGIENDPDLQNHIKTTSNLYITKLFEKLTSAQQSVYIANGLNPEARSRGQQTQQTSQPKKSHEETQRERSQKAKADQANYFKENEYS